MRFAPPPFTLRQLQYAVAVADTRNFRKAAELCHVSQPSLSAQLGELEDALGVRLFERDQRGVLLTGAGDDLVARARRLLMATDDLGEAARRLGDPLAGTLRIGVIPTISPYLLPVAAPALRKRHARLVVAWVEDKTEVLVRSLTTGVLDAALLALEAEIGDLDHEVIARDPFVLAAAVGHPLIRRAAPAAADDLAGEQLLLLDDGHCFREQALAYCKPAGAEEMGFRATSLPTLVQMVAVGSGVTLLPSLAVATETRRAAVVTRALADPAPYRTIALVWRRTSPLASALRQIAGVIRDSYGKTESEPRPARRKP